MCSTKTSAAEGLLCHAIFGWFLCNPNDFIREAARYVMGKSNGRGYFRTRMAAISSFEYTLKIGIDHEQYFQHFGDVVNLRHLSSSDGISVR